ncbi:MAG: hypothetical protein AB7G35_08740 [Hyphomicrobiaceae bacterium]
MNIYTQPLDNATWPGIVAVLQASPRFEASFTAFQALEGNGSRTRDEFAKALLEPLTSYGMLPGIQHQSDEWIATQVMVLLLGHTINSNNSREI